jgi:hypothetical protein
MDLLMDYQCAYMGRVNQFGIIPKVGPPKLSLRVVVWWRVGSIQREE